MDFDFSGWATVNNKKCSDGRTILRDAFKHNDGHTVPLVWNHQHNESFNVLGHALLENRPEGVYTYGKFNDTESGQNAKLLVEHGDVTALSIYANHLKQEGGNVKHGTIREVSLVLAGANPDAYVDSIIKHGIESDEEAIIYTGKELELKHSDYEHEPEEMEEELEEEELEEELEEEELEEDFDDEEEENTPTVEEVFDTMTEEQQEAAMQVIDAALSSDEELEHADFDADEVAAVFDTLDELQKQAVYTVIGAAMNEEELEHADSEGETIQDIFNTLSEKQKNVVYAMIGMAISNEGGKEDMKHNVFENNMQEESFLSHADMETILSDAKRIGSLKEAVLAHSEDGVLAHAVYNEDRSVQEYGIANIDYLFPDANKVSNTPDFIQRKNEWVSVVMNGVHHTPFSRIKSVHADITMEEARARGYMKGNLKVEEVFELLRRTTTPQTVYKKQKLDKDDIRDITDFDVVAWLKAEMRMMLDEELARAILIGDGRTALHADKIKTDNIRPIWTDADLYTIKVRYSVPGGATDDQKAKAFIRKCVKARKDYRGAGNPVMFTTEDLVTDCLLMEDSMGRIIYDTEEKLRTALRVSKIVTVPVMENQTREVEGQTYALQALIVNLNDYNVGADKGGAVDMFEDFDIDYNQEKYLIETRCSGAMITPKGAMAIEQLAVDSGESE